MNSSTVPDNRDVFDIKEKICHGSFGSTIFKAYNEALGQVAIAKKYSANLTNDYEGFMAILDSVRKCQSPHIVTLYGYYKAVKYFWVVMEFCHGCSLHNLMTHMNRPLKESQIRTVANHTLRGLAALHERGIVHTRIRASNILVTTFGICKVAEPGPQVSISDPGVNVDGIVGNAYWSAPEVLLQQKYSTASDIWSLGITIIELAEQQPPYAETHPSRVMVTIPTKPPPEFLNPALWSKYLKVFLSSCLKKDLMERLSAAQLYSQKIIKKAEYRGMQNMVQKFIKIKQNSNSRFYTEPSKPVKAEQRVEEVPLDEGSWTQSGTLVWSPSQSTARSQPSASNANGPSKKMTTTEFNSPLEPTHPPRRSSSFNQPSESNKKELRATKSSPPPAQRTNNSLEKPNKRGRNRKNRASTSSMDSEGYFADVDTIKSGDFVRPPSQKVAEDKKTPQHPLQQTQSNPMGPDPSLPRLSKNSEGVKSSDPSHSQAGKGEDSSPYNDKTVKVKEAENYTPSYMDFYKDTEPEVIEEEDVQPQSGLSRRNSIDDRGKKEEMMKEELRKELEKVDMDYCAELALLRHYFLSRYEAINQALMDSPLPSKAAGEAKLNFYGKLRKMELTLMLKYMNQEHEEELKKAREHFDLEHRFLMNALRTTTDRDAEMRYNMSIRENNETQADTTMEINRRFQFQTEEIMKAIERIDCAGAIAEE